MTRAALISVWLCAPCALASPKALAIATGDCKSPELTETAAAFSDAVAQQLKTDALDSAQVLERFRPRPTAGLDEAQRQIDAAQSQFYAGQHDKALEATRGALKTLERLPPSTAVFFQITQGHVLEGLVLKAQNKKSEQVDAWRRVLRVRPEHKLDPDYHTPATIQLFDQVRKDTERLKKVALSVSSTPAGAQVFVDGAEVGKTPFKGSFPAGDYRVTVAQGEQQSFVYDAKLDKPVELQVDLAFEGAVRPQLPLCVTAGGQDFERALKLAARAGADQALVIRVESRNNEPGWVAAVLLEVQKGARVREGGMKVAAARKDGGYADLASFVLTGQPAKLSLDRGMRKDEPLAAAEPQPAAAAAAPSEPEVEAVEPERKGGGIPRVVSGSVMGAGAVAAIAGLVVYATGGSDRAALAERLDANGQVKPEYLADAANIARIDQAVKTNRSITIGLAATGAVALAAGAIMFFALAPKQPQLSLSVTPSGVYAGVTGSF